MSFEKWIPLAEALDTKETRYTLPQKFVRFVPDDDIISFNTMDTGAKDRQEAKTEALGWHPVLCSQKQIILVADKPTEFELELRGDKGWKNLEKNLELYGKELYSSRKLGIEGGAITYEIFRDDLPKELKRIKKPYWLSKKYMLNKFQGVMYVKGDMPKNKDIYSLEKDMSEGLALAIRPIAYLPKNILVDMTDPKSGDSQETALKIMLHGKSCVA